MKRLGYVYKVFPAEGKGILLTIDNSKIYNDFHFDKYTTGHPVIFSIDNFIGECTPNTPVYYNTDSDGSPCEIERASLLNFDIDVYQSLKCFKVRDDVDIRILNKLKSEICTPLAETDSRVDQNKIIIIDENVAIPFEDEDCDDYDLYDDEDDEDDQDEQNYLDRHYFIHGYRTVDFQKIEIWMTDDLLSGPYFGKNATEFLTLFNLMSGYKVTEHHCFFSPTWGDLLNNMPDDEVFKVYESLPAVQPVLPHHLSKSILSKLSYDYSYCDGKIAYLHFKYLISKVNSYEDYKDLRNILYGGYSYIYDSARPQEIGFSIHDLSKRNRNYCTKQLEIRLYHDIVPVIIDGLVEMGFELNDAQEMTSDERGIDFSYQIICFNEKISEGWDLIYESIRYISDNCPSRFLDSVRTVFKGIFDKIIKHYIVSSEFSVYELYFNLRYALESKEESIWSWINPSTIESMRPIMHDLVLQTTSFFDLSSALEEEIISVEEFDSRFDYLTSDYSLVQFLEVIDQHNCPTVKSLCKAINGLLRKENFEENPVTLETRVTIDSDTLYLYKDIHDLKGLIEYAVSESDQCPKDFITNELQYLDNEDLWRLFEMGLILCPDEAKLRTLLDRAYDDDDFSSHLFQYETVQSQMVKDAINAESYELFEKLIKHIQEPYIESIASALDKKHLFWLSTNNLNDTFDPNKIEEYVEDIPTRVVWKLFKYSFMKVGKTDMFNNYLELCSFWQRVCLPTHKPVHAICSLIAKYLKKEPFTDSIYDAISNCNNEELGFILPLCHGYQKGQIYGVDYEMRNYVSNIVHIKKHNEDGKECYMVVFPEAASSYHDYFYYHYYDSESDNCTFFKNAIERLRILFEMNIHSRRIDSGVYLVDISRRHELAAFAWRHHLYVLDHCGLFDESIYDGESFFVNRVKTSDTGPCVICECAASKMVAPNGLPFHWCKGQACLGVNWSFVEKDKFESFMLHDILYMIKGYDPSCIDEIKEFSYDLARTINNVINGHETSESFGQKIIDENLIPKDEDIMIYEEEDEDDYMEDEYDSDDSSDINRHSYGRYRGTYAQDDAGYSDDDIDTIFDGDPSAYWNID